MKEWLRAGTIIGTYQILMRVGVSGLGEVYRARDDVQNIDGALKLLPSSLCWSEESARRFVEILRTSPTLEHPNISKVLDAGIDQDGRPYAVTQYVRGQSLDEIGIGLARTMAEKIHIAMQIADALEFAHQQGVLHLSLKPANVMLTSTGGVKVLDFVVSLAIQVALMMRGPSAPKVKPTIGSARYLSPEQVRGEKPTRQSDVFSLGTVCYELFAGQLPFSGRSAEEITVAIVRDQPMALTAYVPDAPERLNEIILKALEKNPAIRYQTAAEFATELKALTLEQRDLQFEQAEAIKKKTLIEDTVDNMWRWLKMFLRQYLLRIIAGFVLMGMALASGLAYLYFQQEDHNFHLPTEVTPATKVTSSGRVTALALAPSGTGLAYVTENGGKRTLLYKDTTGTRDTVLAQSSDAEITGVTIALDGEWVYYLKDVAPAGELYVCSVRGGYSRKVLSNIASPVTFAPSGKEFAFVRMNGTESQIVVAQAKSDAPLSKVSAVATLPANAPTSAPTNAPTNALVPGSGSPKGQPKPVVATNIPAEAQHVLLSRYSPNFILPNALSWSHDGNTIAAVVKKPGNDLVPEIVGFDVQTTQEKTLCAAPGPHIEGVAWLSGDTHLLINARTLTDSQRQLWKVKLADGKTRALTAEHEDFSGLSVSIDGTKALSIKTSRSVSLWLGTDDKALELTNNHDDGMSGLAWLNANHLVHVSRASGGDALWVTPTDGSPSQYPKWGSFDSLKIQRYPAVIRTQGTVYFVGIKQGQSALYEINLSDLTKTVKPIALTQGPADFFPQPEASGKGWFHVSFNKGHTSLLRTETAGGAAITLLDGKVWRCALAPDGQQLAANYFDETSGKWKIIVFPANGGQATGMFEAPGDAWRPLGWMPDSQGVAYIITQNGVSNLWQQPLNGNAPAPVTTFTRHRLYDFAWSPDGKQLAVVRGRSNDDAMILDSLK